MAGRVKFTCVGLEMTATLNDSKTAAEVFAGLPLEELADAGAGYVCFSAQLALEEEEVSEEVSAGAVAYWPAGGAICVFFGGRPPTPVTVIGSLNGNALQWRNILSGTPIKMEKA